MNEKVIIIGAGENGYVIANILQKKYQFTGFLDDHKKGNDILGTSDKFVDYADKCAFFISIGNNTARKKKYMELEKSNVQFVNAIHDTAIIEKNVKIGKNVFIGAGSYININATIGDDVFVNNGCIVEHDNTVGSHSHLTPGVITGGGVSLGESCFIGLGAIINDHLRLGERVTIGSGSVVINNIESGITAVGIPAKIISK